MQAAESSCLPLSCAQLWPISLAAYASASVKKVWLVLAPEKQIEVHRQPAGGQFAERVAAGPGAQLVSVALPSFTVNLDALFAK